MARRCRLCLLTVFGVLMGVGCLAAEPGVLLRYTTYLMVQPGPAPVPVRLESRAYGDRHGDHVYSDSPEIALLDASGLALEESSGRLGETLTMAVPASAAPFVLLRLAPGGNYLQASLAAPHAMVATPSAPLHCVGGLSRQYFLVPRGVTTAAVWFHAISVGEAGRALVYRPDGALAAELEDDFNEPTPLEFQVPEGLDGQVWSVVLEAPRRPEWRVDDCAIWLAATLPGLLSPEPAWAEALSRPLAMAWRTVMDFEGDDAGVTVQWDRAPPAGVELLGRAGVSTARPHRGRQSLRLEMALPEGYDGATMLKAFTRAVPAAGCRRVSFWFHGDGSGRQLQVRLRDAHGEHFHTPALPITWEGWRQVVVDVAGPGTVAAGGDGNQQVDGPEVVLVFQIRHAPGQPRQVVYDLDDVAVSP